MNTAKNILSLHNNKQGLSFYIENKSLKKFTTMARPIAETPTLYGRDSVRFAENMRKVENLSDEERRANREALDQRIKSAEKKWGKIVFSV